MHPIRPAHWGKFVILFFLILSVVFYSALHFPNKKGLPPTAKIPRLIENFALLDESGRFHELYYYSDKKAIVLMAHQTDCPHDQKLMPYLNSLNKQFENDIVFLMIDAKPADTRKTLQRESLFWQNKIPVLIDETQLISQSLNLSQSSEVIVIDTDNWNAVYQGAVKDSNNTPVLEQVLISLTQGSKPDAQLTPSKGCPIPYYKKNINQEISYVHDVYPILKQKCLPCHTNGGLAPWSMNSYETIRGWAPMMREVLRTKRMPPWHADPHFGEFTDDLSLSNKEFQTLIQWLENSTPRGKGDDPLKKQKIKHKQEWVLGTPDLIFHLSEEQEIPANGSDEFRFIEADKNIEQNLWIGAIDFIPSNPSVVHHSNVAFLKEFRTGIKNTNAVKLAQDDMWIGNGIGGNGVDEMLEMNLLGIIHGYAPGRGPFVFPKDTGALIPKDSKLIFQMHYITTGRKEKDFTKIGFYLLKEQPKNIFSIKTAANRGIRIPPYEKNYNYQASYTLIKDLTLTAFQPHMHYRGKSMRFTIVHPHGKKEIALSVPNYKFHWQRMYILKEPIPLRKGTQILADAVFDNSPQNTLNPDPSKEILYGPRSQDEMFTGILFFYDESGE